MEIIELAPVVATNPFSADIQALATMTEENELAAGEFVIPDSEVGKAKFKIAKAANSIDLTAALALEEPGKTKNTTRLVYRLKPRHKTGPRTPKTVETVESVESDELELEHVE